MSCKIFSQNSSVCIRVITTDDYDSSDAVLLAHALGNGELLLGFQLGSAGADDVKSAGVAVLVDVCVVKDHVVVFQQTAGAALKAVEDILLVAGLQRVIQAANHVVAAGSLTAGEDECRAWTIKEGTKAPQAAGKIHTDFERGFIKAEVVNYQDLLDNGSLSAAREKGIVGMEGKDYVVKDGDVILFRFNV